MILDGCTYIPCIPNILYMILVLCTHTMDSLHAQHTIFLFYFLKHTQIFLSVLLFNYTPTLNYINTISVLSLYEYRHAPFFPHAFVGMFNHFNSHVHVIIIIIIRMDLCMYTSM